MINLIGYGCLICGKEFMVKRLLEEHFCRKEDIKRWRSLTQKETGLVREGNEWIKRR